MSLVSFSGTNLGDLLGTGCCRGARGDGSLGCGAGAGGGSLLANTPARSLQRFGDLADQEFAVGAAGLLANDLGVLRLQLVQFHLGQVRDLLLGVHWVSLSCLGRRGLATSAYWFQFVFLSPRNSSQVSRFRVATHEAPSLLVFEPGLYLDAIIGGDTASACDLFFVAQVGTVTIRVVVESCRALHDRHDADLATAQVRVLGSVVGRDASENLRHCSSPCWGSLQSTNTYGRSFANTSSPIATWNWSNSTPLLHNPHRLCTSRLGLATVESQPLSKSGNRHCPSVDVSARSSRSRVRGRLLGEA